MLILWLQLILVLAYCIYDFHEIADDIAAVADTTDVDHLGLAMLLQLLML